MVRNSSNPCRLTPSSALDRTWGCPFTKTAAADTLPASSPYWRVPKDRLEELLDESR